MLAVLPGARRSAINCRTIPSDNRRIRLLLGVDFQHVPSNRNGIVTIEANKGKKKEAISSKLVGILS